MRTDAQDGKDDAEESRIDKIWHAVGNVYEVQYVDMGWHGFTVFLFTSEDGNVKIDDFVKIMDESVEGYGSWSEGLVEINANGHKDQVEFVVSDDGDIFSEGEYLFTDGDHYIVMMQDYLRVPIAGHRKVTYSAENGQGFIYTYQADVKIRESPSTNSAVVAVMPISEEMEETEDCKCFPCLGKIDGWYKISINGKVGYVKEDMAIWSCMEFL